MARSASRSERTGSPLPCQHATPRSHSARRSLYSDAPAVGGRPYRRRPAPARRGWPPVGTRATGSRAEGRDRPRRRQRRTGPSNPTARRRSRSRRAGTTGPAPTGRRQPPPPVRGTPSAAASRARPTTTARRRAGRLPRSRRRSHATGRPRLQLARDAGDVVDPAAARRADVVEFEAGRRPSSADASRRPGRRSGRARCAVSRSIAAGSTKPSL